MVTVLSVFGTRPEASKMAPVIKALESCAEEFESLVCVTALGKEIFEEPLFSI